jgi:protein-S-isoprenylcysteine O-methyltransferase Ste14
MKSQINGKLLARALIRFLLAFIFVAVLLFLPAGSLEYYNGWLFLCALFIPMSFVLIYLIVRDPALLEKRMKTDEKEKPQKVYLVLSILATIATFAIPGFDYRFQWSNVPVWLVVLSTVFMITGYFLFFLVMKQNSYASRVVEIQEEQKLIDTGLYSIVRHPLYSGAILLYGFAPIVLGSFYALIPMIFIPILLAIRIKNEEKVLLEGLKGYDAYMKKVKFRLLPFLW